MIVHSERSLETEAEMLAKLALTTVAAVAFGAAAHAQNGRNPPNVNPTHYQCYNVEAPSDSTALRSLRDQFGIAENVKIAGPVMLCAPAGKNGVGPRDR